MWHNFLRKIPGEEQFEREKENLSSFGSLEFKGFVGHLHTTISSRSRIQEGGRDQRYLSRGDRYAVALGDDSKNQPRGKTVHQQWAEDEGNVKVVEKRKEESQLVTWMPRQWQTKTKGVSNAARCGRKSKINTWESSGPGKRGRWGNWFCRCSGSGTVQMEVVNYWSGAFVFESWRIDTSTPKLKLRYPPEMSVG